MKLLADPTALFVVCLVAAGGCRMFHDDASAGGKSPLRPARPSPDSVTMEIVWARFPAGDPQLNDAVWHDVDETQIAPAVRRALANNGFRVGVIGGTLPNGIARALHHGEHPAEDPAEPNEPDEISDLLAEPIVHGRIRQLPRDQRYEIQASDVYPSLPLLVNGGRELSGRTYQQAQAIYALRVDPQPDRTVLVELTPELHHGAPSIRWTRGDDGSGILRQAPLRDREVFHELRMNVKLAPGEMLLLMSLPDEGSRLGQYFHTVDSSEGLQQKLILIRLAQVPPSDTFANVAEY
jgi:hypothetical protein